MNQQKHLESKSMSIALFAFLFFMYAVVYMTKNMFSSAMAIIVEEGFMTKTQTGFINAVFWFVYALFQFIGGFAVDKYKPHKLIMIGLGGAAIANFVIYMNQSYPVIIAAWALNAALQFGLWPGIFKIVSTQLKPDMRGTAVFWLLFSTSVGIGLSMLVASFVGHWQNNFLISAVSLLVILLVYPVLNRCMDKKMVVEETASTLCDTPSATQKAPMLPLVISSGFIIFLIVCLFRGAIDNGIKMLTPVMLMESYDQLPAAIATRMSSVLIIFSALGILLSGVIQRKITKCEAKAQILLYSLSILPLILVCFVGRIHYIYILLSLSLAVMLLHGASPFSQSFAALHFEKYGRIGTASGILNATASVGNILASYVFAKMAETMPWNGVAASWLIVIIGCGVLCAAVLPAWTKFVKK